MVISCISSRNGENVGVGADASSLPHKNTTARRRRAKKNFEKKPFQLFLS